MNIIKVENVGSILGFVDKLEVKTGYKKEGVSNYSMIVILDADDIDNDNTLIKFRGLSIHALIIPKKYKHTFNESKYYEVIKNSFTKNAVISYY